MLIILDVTIQEISMKSLSRTDEIEALFKIYQQTVKGESTQRLKHQHIGKETHPKISYIKPEQSKVCAIRERQKHDECRKPEKVSNSIVLKSQCADSFDMGYSTCFFGKTLNAGHPEPNKCLRLCLLYMDACLIESNKLETFICMKARDKCINHCSISDCDAHPKRTRSVAGKKLQIATASSCKRNCAQQKKNCLTVFKNNFVCNYAFIECSSTCRIRSRISPPSLKTSVMVED
jgi:hypothetical protein